MINRKTGQGSMTIFAALSLMLITAFLFTLLEAARLRELQKIVRINTASVAESLFSAYQIPLWEKYHLLLLEGDGNHAQSSLINEVRRLSEDNLTLEGTGSVIGTDLLALKTVDVQIDEYLLITDGEGQVFACTTAAYMKNKFSLEMLEKDYTAYESIKSMNLSGSTGKDPLEEATHVVKTETKNNKQSNENPINSVNNARKRGILNLVINNEDTISGAEIDVSTVVSKRDLQVGTAKENPSIAWYDTLLMQQYLMTHFSSYTNPIENHALSYEIEYLLCGKSSDAKNLEETAQKLLAVREVANLAYLMTDATKQNEAMSIATLLAGATGNPAIVEVVKYGILAAWAYAESILDVRALLAGDKISLIKTSSEWTSDIYNLSLVFEKSGKAKSCSYGMEYSDYLGVLLLLQGIQTTAYRAMDMQETTVRLQEGYENFFMDHMIVEAEVVMNYQYQSIFLGMEPLTDSINEGIGIPCSYKYSYRKAGA